MQKEFQNIRKTNLFKFFCILAILLSSFLLFSCNKEQDKNPQDEVKPNKFPTEMLGILKNNTVYFTSLGQSADVDNFEYTILKQLNLFEYTVDKKIGVEEIPEGSVVIAFVGCSVKGLGESGITVEQELERAKTYTEACRDRRFTLICCHSGGPSRRGSTSDSIIKEMFSGSDFNVYVSSGNFDSYLSTISEEHHIPSYEVSTFVALDHVIKLLYGETV